MTPLRLALLAAIVGLPSVSWSQTQSADVDYGHRLAQRYCGACHAVDVGQSPNPAAPPFRMLYQRYRAGGLDALLTEGMLAPVDPPEEGAPRLHPRMPQAVLGDDEIDALKAYLHSLEPSTLETGAAAARH